MKTTKIIFLLVIILFSFSCQNEEIIIDDEPASENLTGDSPLVNLLSRVARNPTSHDNVLDNSSCFSVQLPVTVFVNGIQIVVNTTADYQTVKDAIDAFSNDDDLVTFVYPITIEFQNSNTQVIANSNQLDDVIEDCDEDDDFNEISCISINFPVYINTYNNGNQTVNTVAIQNKRALFNFLRNIIRNPNITITIQYPISIVNSSGVTVVVNSNEELLLLIEDALANCVTGNTGNTGNLTLQSVIVNGTWRITYYFRNNVIQTTDFTGYNFTFNPNNTVVASGVGTPINGTWIINSMVMKRELSLIFKEIYLTDCLKNGKL
ncbi:MAG: hypothetical protein HC854_05845 [Flavobacterium sp.]|nr:hypothetical protein [Flavobacterium sp.]